MGATRHLSRYPLTLARNLFLSLVPLLGLDRHSRDGPRIEPSERNRLARDLVIATVALLDPGQRGIDLGDKLALAIARTQLDRPVALVRSAVVRIGFPKLLHLQYVQRGFRLEEDLLLPGQQPLAEIFELKRIHEFLNYRGAISER